MGRKELKRRLLSDNLTADGCNNKLEVKGVTRAVSEHPHRRGRPSQKTISVSVTQRPEGPFSLIVARLLEDQKYLDFCCHFFYGTETKKKTPITLYDSETPAQDNSLYNLLLYAWLESRCMRKLLV